MKNEIKDKIDTSKRRTLHIKRRDLTQVLAPKTTTTLTEVLFLTSYPPRECGIATYSQDLVRALELKFGPSFKLTICTLDAREGDRVPEAKYNLDTENPGAFRELGMMVNYNPNIGMVMIQHEFGLFKNNEAAFIELLQTLRKPVIMTFHTVLPNPGEEMRYKVWQLGYFANAIIVMTKTSKALLERSYSIDGEKISVISHGTHLVGHEDREVLKVKYLLAGKKVLSTFGLLGPGKSIETTLEALPSIVAAHPDVIFLIIGKTHPSLQESQGEGYRDFLSEKVAALALDDHVLFINKFLKLQELLEYLQLSDIYLFTSKDPNQAVSGTFSYAMSCGCPIISTPIPHALEALGNDSGIIVDFTDPEQLSRAVLTLLQDDGLRRRMGLNGLQKSASSAWENATIAHARLFSKISEGRILLRYVLPELNLSHIRRMTTDFGMIQFAVIGRPDVGSGYTLDDNARALIALCRYYEATLNASVLTYIRIYFNFIVHCYQSDGLFLNYVTIDREFSEENSKVNLEDSNGRAIWALGYLRHMASMFSEEFGDMAEAADHILQESMPRFEKFHSPRAMSFIIKGLYFNTLQYPSYKYQHVIRTFGNRLARLFESENEPGWLWFESYLTYANSVLPEALLCAWLRTGETHFKNIAKTSFDFLLSTIFHKGTIRVVSNKNWLQRDDRDAKPAQGGEQPIDVAYTILALDKFRKVFPNEDYGLRMRSAFNWFLGNNHLHQIIYNPCTGGCYDGLEECNVNLNQGAESTISYLLSRLAFEKPRTVLDDRLPALLG